MKSLFVFASTILHVNTRFRYAGAFAPTMKRARDNGQRDYGHGRGNGYGSQQRQRHNNMNANDETESNSSPPPPPLYLEEGLLAVHKPLTWTSNDVVSYIRGILTRDAGDRGAKPPNNNNNRGKRSRKPMFKVGHGGTLDPLASGVLVLGVGKGTTSLQSYLEGSKHYSAVAELGYETDTLDAEGKMVKTAAWDHVTDIDTVKTKILPKFTGKIEQVPPLYSAIRIDGKRLYEIARKDDSGEAAAKIEIPKREVEIYEMEIGTEVEESVVRSGVVDGAKYRDAVETIEAAAAEAAKVAAAAAAAAAAAEAAKQDGAEDDIAKNEGESKEDEGLSKSQKNRKRRNKNTNKKKGNFKKSPFTEIDVPSMQADNASLELPRFGVSVKCGGGTYIRSLVRDIGYELDTVATMTGLVRTKQGPFVLEDALRREDWNADMIYEAIRKGKEKTQQIDESKD